MVFVFSTQSSYLVEPAVLWELSHTGFNILRLFVVLPEILSGLFFLLDHQLKTSHLVTYGQNTFVCLLCPQHGLWHEYKMQNITGFCKTCENFLCVFVVVVFFF